jgi:O-Antigen ligase
LAENGVTSGTFGALSRPDYQRLGRLVAVVSFVALGVIAMLISCEVAALIAKHYRRYREWILMGAFFSGVPLSVFVGIALWQGILAGVKTLKELKWWHLLWAVLFMSGLILRKRSSTEAHSNPVDSAAAYRIGCVGLVGLVLLLRLFLRRTEWLKSLTSGIMGAFTWFVLTCAVSTLWSVYWEWTFYKACEYSVDIAMMAVIVYMVRNTEEMKSWFDWTWMLYGALLVSAWFWVPIDPSDALSKNFEYGEAGIGLLGFQLVGVMPDVAANGIGEYGAIFGAIALARLLPYSRKRRDLVWYTFLFLFSLVTMFFAQCRSAILAFCMAVFLIFLCSRRVLQGAIIFVSGAVVFLATGLGDLAWKYLQRGQSTAQLTSLSSRLNWWSVAWEKFTDAPLTGLGAWAAGRFGVLAKLGHKQTATMHSDWVETVVGTGIWGVIPIVVIMVWSWWILIRFIRNPEAYGLEADVCLEAIGVLGVLTVRMFFMTDLTLHPPLDFFVPLGYAEYLRRRARYTGAKAPKLLFTP